MSSLPAHGTPLDLQSTIGPRGTAVKESPCISHRIVQAKLEASLRLRPCDAPYSIEITVIAQDLGDSKSLHMGQAERIFEIEICELLE